jgi:hypothetical protein
MYFISTAISAIAVLVLASPQVLVKAENRTVEVDIFFPRNGGSYSTSAAGIPIIIGVQNSPIAFEYGWAVWWDLYLEPRGPNSFIGDESGVLSAAIGDTAPAANPFIAVNTTGYLKSGNYTLEWIFGVHPWCEFLYDSPTNWSNTWSISREVTSGSLQFLVLDNSQTSPQLEDDCPSMLGVVSYASTTLWTHSALTVTIDTPATYAAETSACVVTEPATYTPGSCGVVLDAAVKTSVSEMMGWAVASSTTNSATIASTTSTNSSPTSSSTSEAQILLPMTFLSLVLSGATLALFIRPF